MVNYFFKKVRPENYDRLVALENHNEALVERMASIEKHLMDRNRNLSQCRYSYFMEITHLRNQVYLGRLLQQGKRSFPML